MSTSDLVLVEQKKSPSGALYEVWTLNRPQALNALNLAVILQIGKEVMRLGTQLHKDLASCRALVLTGAGDKAFVAGADIAAMRELGPVEAEAFARKGQDVFAALEALPIPVIAAVNGFALGGGCELACACDLIIASSKAKFGQPEVHLGLVPGYAGSYRFARKLGYSKALELLMSGGMLNAQEAENLGLVQRLCPEGTELMAYVTDWVDSLSKKSAPLAVAQCKQLLQAQVRQYAETAQDREAKAFGGIFATQDAREGMCAFLEKRSAKFSAK